MPAMTLFVMALNAIKETAIKQVEDNRKNMFGDKWKPLNPRNVLYVLTVPAIWEDEVNQKKKRVNGSVHPSDFTNQKNVHVQ
ncbi:hypothetical protein RFI_07579 [Reticulomyxa filosa]|uniref:Uncharacterized protein n=1 Tax=Reticulomyxa filosa TaxID=46433 RepID=X6NTD6_RETFI|nr:hypothetical protein RFI_07579 [Reticulomyxa filosa]|eukprot:ETO29540.1 hypothetical protein RFI_07579 [Reticulomyxa filosa]